MNKESNWLNVNVDDSKAKPEVLNRALDLYTNSETNVDQCLVE